MKDPWTWTETDLQRHVLDRIPESLNLDYKGIGALTVATDLAREKTRSDISKDVSAFANSAGGTIIYGISEDRETHLPRQLEQGFDPKVINHDWIEQVINSKIQRRVEGVRINPVELATSAPGRFAFVVWVPQSVRAPHMASDHRYYKRFNFESVPMEDYEVRDVARRIETPRLSVAFGFAEPYYLNFSDPGRERLGFHVVLENHSDEPADCAVIDLWIDARFRVVAPGDFRLAYHALRESEDGLNWDVYRLSWARTKLPVFRDVGLQVTSSPIVIDAEAAPRANYPLQWRVKTPRTEMTTGWEILGIGPNSRRWLSNLALTDTQIRTHPEVDWPGGKVPTSLPVP